MVIDASRLGTTQESEDQLTWVQNCNNLKTFSVLRNILNAPNKASDWSIRKRICF